jgi:NADPH-dependent 2,4-dienoyl-CoA reductase/sulfur reductase-like enzyme
VGLDRRRSLPMSWACRHLVHNDTGGGLRGGWRMREDMTVAGQREHSPAASGAAGVGIVGAGFGGLAAMRRLARAGMQATLIDRNVYSTFQPLLYEVATAGLTSSDVAFPARSVARRHHAAFRHGELAGIDPAARQITLADGATLGYDYLILATGVWPRITAFPGQPNTAWACTPATMPSSCAIAS